MPSRLSGVVKTASFRVAPGDTILLDGPLDIRSTGDVMIIGDIRADAGTPPGSGVKIASARGNIVIRGRVETAPGAAGETPPVAISVVAGPGKPGGALEIAAATGSLAILGRAVLQSGKGGDGGNATARGTGAEAPLIQAVSGAGAPGGKIALAAAYLLSIEGTVRGGDGGWGGEAIATALPTNPPPPLPDPPPNRPANQRPPNQRPPKPPPPGYPAVVEATGKAGGAGGDIEIATTISIGMVAIDGTVRGGDGGCSNEAIANGVQPDARPGTGARRAQALLETGGRGGNVTITLKDSLFAVQAAGHGELRGGTGGDAGDRSAIGSPPAHPNDPPVLFVDGATATASEVAMAWVGHPLEVDNPAGGAAGTVTATAVWSGTPPRREPIVLGGAPSFGGDASGALATAGKITRHEWDDTHVGAVPGKVRKADVP